MVMIVSGEWENKNSNHVQMMNPSSRFRSLCAQREWKWTRLKGVGPQSLALQLVDLQVLFIYFLFTCFYQDVLLLRLEDKVI